jgi:hypothetical protein
MAGVTTTVLVVASIVMARSALAGSTVVSQPTELDLTTAACGTPHAHCWVFPLAGQGQGTIIRTSVPLLDQGGAVVGTHRADCALASKASGVCTIVLTLHDGGSTDDGTITLSGVYAGGTPATFAVTGGTGAYEGVSGHMLFEFDGTSYPTTLFLTP